MLETVLATFVRAFGVSPNLTLLVVVAWTLLRGRSESMLVGLVSGVVLDILSGGPFGSITVSLLLISFLAGYGELNIFRTARLLPYITIVLASLLYYIITVTFLEAQIHVRIWGAALGSIVLPAVILNALCMPVIYGIGYWLRARLTPKPVEWE